VIRVDAVWLALGVSDLRGGIDVLLAPVVRGFSDLAGGS
jgi:transposase